MLEDSSCPLYQSFLVIEGNACVCRGDVVSGAHQGRVFEPLLFIFYNSELFHIVGNHIVGYADDTTIYAIIPRQLSHPQVIKSLNQDLAAVNSWFLKWRMRPNSKKTKSMVISLSGIIALGYGDLTWWC